MHRLLVLQAPISLFVLAVGCQMSNPAFEQDGGTDTGGQDSVAGDGDGDGGSSNGSTGDGDGDSGDGDGDSTGDGDGDSTGDGDGDTNTGDGDGDGNPDTGDGDGDGGSDSTTGDGDGDSTTGDGDGDGDPVMCVMGEELCGDMCIDTQFDNGNCGGCGNPCGDGELCGFGECKHAKIVFVTSMKVLGNFGGIQGGNAICSNAANAAQLQGGSFKAWLSDPQNSPSTTFNADAVWVLPGGQVVAYGWDDLIDGQLEHAIDQTEFGQPVAASPACNNLGTAVWTGTHGNGAPEDPHCGGWTLGGDVPTGRTGSAQSTDIAWTSTPCLAPCNTAHPIYCFEL